MGFPVAVAAAAPAVIGAVGSYFGQRTANRQTRRLVREQMAFQERMSGTAYQRAVSDMRLAGINPMLAYQQGGASTPGGASAEMKSELGAGVSSAVASSRVAAELRAINASVGKTEAETANLHRQGTILDLEVMRSRALQPAMDVAGRGISTISDAFSARNMEILRHEIPRGLAAGGRALIGAAGQTGAGLVVRGVRGLSRTRGFKAVRATIGRSIRRLRR